MNTNYANLAKRPDSTVRNVFENEHDLSIAGPPGMMDTNRSTSNYKTQELIFGLKINKEDLITEYDKTDQ